MSIDLTEPLAPDPDAAVGTHAGSGAQSRLRDLTELVEPADALRAPKQWLPRRVVVTPAALDTDHGAAIIRRCEALGIEVERLAGNRLTGMRQASERETYALAKSTLAIVVSPPSKLRPQPIPPSADWHFHLAEGCPAHCQYCYLAGSLTGPPVTRVYANLGEILAALEPFVGQGTVTSRSPRRAGEGTTFEASCYTDPLALEHLTGALAGTIRFFGAWDAPVQLRWTTKFDNVAPLLELPHSGRTRIRFSVNALPVTTRFEGGTARLGERLDAMRQVALAGYPVGLTIAPIIALPDWKAAYGALLDDVGRALADVPRLDLSAELITHRFTPGSRDVLLGWYPRTRLEMDPETRSRKHGRYGAVKYVYPRDLMRKLRSWFARELPARLPGIQLLYFT